MSRERHGWNARESIIRRKKLMELEDTMFKQGSSKTGLTALRFVKGVLPRRRKTAEDLERGWNSNYKADPSKQPSFKSLPCFGYKDKAVRGGDLCRDESEKSKSDKIDEGWVNTFKEQKTKELHEVYGKDSVINKSIDKRLKAGWVGACKEQRGENGKPRVSVAEWQKARFQKRLESSPISGRTHRSNGSTSRISRSPRSERFFDMVWDTSPKGTSTEAEPLSMDRSYGYMWDAYAYRSGREGEKDLDADMVWTSRRSPRREASGQSVPRASKSAEELFQEREELSRDNSWLTAYQHGQRRKLFGLRSYSIGDNPSQKTKKEDLSWAANCRTKLKAQMTAAV